MCKKARYSRTYREWESQKQGCFGILYSENALAMDDFAERLLHGDITSAYDICMDTFGLEPDYLEDMIEGMI
ncbi:hypothetical protein FMIA91_08150 [Fidelibacter multiformis]